MALDCLARVVPSLLILDLRMPGMDGFQVLAHLRSDESTSYIPVLVLTGQALSLDDIRRLEQYALVTVQTKGILSDDEVAAAIHRSLVATDTLPPTPPRLVHSAASTALRQGLRPVTVLVFAACPPRRSGSGGSRQDADMDRGNTDPRHWTMGISNCRHGHL